MVEQELEKMLNTLNTYTKKDLVGIFEELITSGELTCERLTLYITNNNNKMTESEKLLCDKLTAHEELTDTEKATINVTFETNKNKKVGSIMKAKGTFISFLVGKKLEYVFEQCWKMYPRKVGKQLGAKAFVKLFTDIKCEQLNTTAQYIISKVKAYADECEEEQKEAQFIMHFSTFCNSKKYL